MRFMVEIFEAEIERNSKDGLLDRYPFEIDGREVWIKREDMTAAQSWLGVSSIQLLNIISKSGGRRILETRAQQAGIIGVIDGRMK